MLSALSGILPDSFCRRRRAECPRPLILFSNLVIQTPREQPAYTEHVDGSADGPIAQTVFSLTKTPRAMFHRNFHEPIPCVFDQRRNEAMHSLERKQHRYALAAHCLKRATGVAHAVPCIAAPDRVGDPAGEPFHKRVPALCAITAHEISAP